MYIILCSDSSLYTGISNNIQKRFEQHKNKKGAKYFYGRSPEKIVFIEAGHSRSSASKREFELKGLSKIEKQVLIENYKKINSEK